MRRKKRSSVDIWWLAVAMAVATACDGEPAGVAGFFDGTPPTDAAVSDAAADSAFRPFWDATPPDGAAPDAEPATDSAPSCPPDQCAIDGLCYANEAVNPDNPCEICLASMHTDVWSPDDAAACDDHNACTDDDFCIDGACTGHARACTDGNPCTADECDSATGECEFPATDAPCDDGDPCTTGDVCEDSVCRPGHGPPCDDDNPCTADACGADGRCVHGPTDGECDDGDPCTDRDVCVDGACSGAAVDCDDENFCTVDFCNALGACDHRSVADACADDNPCTTDACDPVDGCVYVFNDDPCDDVDACTGPDRCAGGRCIGAPIDLDDLNVCTDDVCDRVAGASHPNNDDDCTDNNACTLGDRCADGACVTDPEPLDCDDHNACTDDRCDPTEGCVRENNTDGCDDQNACTESDVCNDGDCGGSRVDCDDHNACTDDSCDAATGCTNTPIASNDCRPVIDIAEPHRAATLVGAPGGTTLVAGSVTSGAGPIVSLTLNGAPVDIDPQTGAFALDFAPVVGTNTLRFEAADAIGAVRERVQAFHWSSDYRRARLDNPATGYVPEGVGIWLAQATLDDDDSALPPNDFATMVELALQGFDLAAFIPSPAAHGGSQFTGTYEAEVDNITWGAPRVDLVAVEGGLAMTIIIAGIDADITAVKECTWSILSLLTCTGPGMVTGTFGATRLVIEATVAIGVDEAHEVEVQVGERQVRFVDAAVTIDGAFGWLVEALLGGFITTMVEDIETEFEGQLQDIIGPMFRDAFAAMAFDTSFGIERPGGAIDPDTGLPETVEVDLVTDFASIRFEEEDEATPQEEAGGQLILRARSAPKRRGVPDGGAFDANLGVPERVGCGAMPQALVVPRLGAMEIIFPDDTLNQILRAAWWGGLLEFPVEPRALDPSTLSALGIENLTMFVRGLMPPLATDCGPDGFEMQIGDLRIDMSLDLFERALTAVVHVSFSLGIELTPGDAGIAIAITGVRRLDAEVEVQQPDLIGAESVIEDIIRAQLIPELEGALAGEDGELATFPLPEVDSSEALNLEPGTASIAVRVEARPDWPSRVEGNNVVYGQLR